MTPAANERRLAGKWIVWWWHESHAIVDMAGNVTEYEYRKIWRYGQVAKKSGDMVVTKQFERVPVRDAWIVDEMAGWPVFSPGSYRPLTDNEFSELARSQP